MTQDQIQAGGTDAGEEEDKPLPQYVIDIESAALHNRAIALLIGSRRCYVDQQGDGESSAADADVKKYIRRIATHCAETADFLLPDTPLKEAIFKVMLAGSNKPINAEEISEILSEKWAMTAYPRDISKEVIQKLMETGNTYCIKRLPDPEVDEPEPVVETPKVVVEAEESDEEGDE